MLQVALCVVVKSVLRLASFSWLCAVDRFFAALCGFVALLFAASLRGSSSRLCCSGLRGLCIFVALCGSAILPLKLVAKAWSLGLLLGRYLHREGILMDHILIVGVPSELGLCLS